MVLSTFSKRAADEAGTGVVTALSISLIAFLLGAVWVNVAVHQVEGSSYEKKREQALNAAEAGVNLAISRLAGDYDWAGTGGVIELADDTGEYEVSVTPVDPGDPEDLDRYIVAKGYAPSKTSTRRAARQLEQQVELIPTDGFEFALFASPGGITGQNNSTVTGDVYSASDIALAQFTNVFGDVTSVGSVSTSNNNTIGGKIHAGVDVFIENTGTDVQGDVWAGGFSAGVPNVKVSGSVDGDVQARGTVQLTGGSVDGDIAEGSPPPEPPVLGLPTFTWDPDNYSPTPSPPWSSAADFTAHWSANKSGFSGHHRVEGGDSPSNTISLDSKWTMTGDVTIAADGPVTLSRDIANGTGGDVTLTIVSFSNADPAIAFTNNVSLPASVKILLFAPEGDVDFSQLKDFHGVVYGKGIDLSQQFTLGYDAPDVPGFSWDASSSVHFDVDVRTFREVPFEE